MTTQLRNRLIAGGWTIGGESGFVNPRTGVAVGGDDFWQRETPNGGIVTFGRVDGSGEPAGLTDNARSDYYSDATRFEQGLKPDGEISGTAGVVLEIADGFLASLSRL